MLNTSIPSVNSGYLKLDKSVDCGYQLRIKLIEAIFTDDLYYLMGMVINKYQRP